MTGADEIIHQQHRLRIMAALDQDGNRLDFATLKAISGATDGNLGAHLQTLEKAGYVALTKEEIGRRSRTWVAQTAKGRRAYRGHVMFLEEVLGLAGVEKE